MNQRQKQIRAFLVEEFGADKGETLFARQEETLNRLIDNQTGKSKSQKKTLAETILPSIALYKALQGALPQDKAYACVQKYMVEKVAAQKHASTAKMEIVPGFYALYSRIFLRVMRESDLWASTQKRGKDAFDVTISKCLWHTTCAENDCPELCRLFCEADNVTYGGLLGRRPPCAGRCDRCRGRLSGPVQEKGRKSANDCGKNEHRYRPDD